MGQLCHPPILKLPYFFLVLVSRQAKTAGIPKLMNDKAVLSFQQKKSSLPMTTLKS